MLGTMKFKKDIIKAAALGMMTLGLASCSDFLDITPQEIIIGSKFWNEKGDVQNVVTSCYAHMQTQAVVGRMMAWGEFRSDNIVGGTNVNNNSDLVNLFKENLNASNSLTLWGDFYFIINTCNTVIEKAPAVQKKDPNYSESDMQANIAEVSALRDLCYFYLIRTFRDVPYTTMAYEDDTQAMAQPAVKFDEVLDSLINDLERVQNYAVKTYPTNKTDYQTGRITQDAIHAMLCDMYLWKQDYANAVKYADMVIDSKTNDFKENLKKMGSMASDNDQLIDGFPLINDKSSFGTSYYGQAFTSIFGTGNSSESIFELTYSDELTMPSNGAVSYYYGNAKTYPGIVKPADFITTDLTLDQPQVFRNKYDCRYYENMRQEGSDYGIAKYDVMSCSFSSVNTDIKPTYGEVYSETHSGANWIIYRLTDVMLMKAEALAQMVDDNATSDAAKQQNDSLLTQALNIVNAVNKRSNCQGTYAELKLENYNTKTLMTNLVMDERQRELMFEGKRWYDLVRRARRDGNTSYLVSKVTRKSSENSSAIQSKLARMDAIYWPYNIDELRVNANLKQNPAFGSGENSSYSDSSSK